MAYIEEDEEEGSDDEIAVERIVTDERSEIRKAREIITHAMLSASTPLENRAVKHRMLPGLWYCAVNVLLASFDIDDINRLMKDRLTIVVGSAENVGSPPKAMKPQEMKAYIQEVGLASETIMEALEAAHEQMEDEGIEDRFPETVFDTALRVLIPAWGPDHVRRAIIEQCAVFILGRPEAVNFMEPETVLDPSQIRRRLPEAPVAKPAAAAQSAITKLSEFEFKPRIVRDRRVRAFVGSDLLANGKAIWAVTMVIRDESGRYEFRKFGGRIEDPSGSRVSLTSLHEACLSLASMKDRAQVVIETTDDMLLRAAESREPSDGTRTEADKDAWTEIEYAVSFHGISFKHVAQALSDPLQESCDHLIRELGQA